MRPPLTTSLFLGSVFCCVVVTTASLRGQSPDRRPEGWSTYRGNNGRTAFTRASLPAGLQLLWQRDGRAPAPAWPAPARQSLWQNLSRIEPRVVDDRAIHPVLAEGRALFGSSREDDVVCLDARTGRALWRVVCEGPVRYAPTVVRHGDSHRVLVGSDDGLVRSLDLRDGREIWRHRVGPAARLIPGNGRLISPYPVRTGVLVADGVAFACAGLFPMQGVFAVALDVETGKPVWRRKLASHSPQGYMLAAGKLLIVPNGRANPFSLRRDSGAPGPNFGGVGGSFAVLADEHLISGRGNDNTFSASGATTAERFVSFPGKELAVTPGVSVIVRSNLVVALDRPRLNRLRAEQKVVQRKLRANRRDKAAQSRLAEIERRIAGCVLWQFAHVDDVASILVAGDVVCLGRHRKIEFRELRSGAERGSVAAPGRVASMAADEGRLVATTAEGHTVCFGARVGPAVVQSAASESESPSAVPSAVALAEAKKSTARWVRSLDSPRGYAVIVEPADGLVVSELARRTQLSLVVVHRDSKRVAELRRELRIAGVYGTRATVLPASGVELPFVSDFANLVLDLSQPARGEGWDEAELRRVAAPGRGVVARAEAIYRRPSPEGAGSWTHQYANPANTADSGDRRIRSDLTLQWFGGPGPSRMIDRHLRGPPPLAIAGRLFIIAENAVLGVDAYNGTELWELALPDSQRYAMPYDAGYIACDENQLLAAVDDRLWVIDPATGEVTRRVGVPSSDGSKMHWGYVGIPTTGGEGDEKGARVVGSAMLPTAPRTTPSRKEVDGAYRSARPIVTSRALFCLRADSFETIWFEKRGAVIHPTITLADGKLFFIESRNEASIQHGTGRVPLATLLAEDAWLVALDVTTGKTMWEKPVRLPGCRNIVYLSAAEGRLVVLGSRDDAQKDAKYHLRVLSSSDGSEIWRTAHGNMKPGQLFHGEQVHHPVILGDLLVAEPFVYRIADGKPVNPEGRDESWLIRRPGHSCGTMSGAGSCLFFRAGNPTALDLGSDVRGERFKKLAPTRAGCWINIIPACGLVLIPEASASCVCHYPLQTSMAFRPVSADRKR